MRILIVFLLSMLPLMAQTQGGISANVSRTIAVTPDEANFTIVISTSLDASQQQVTDALQAAGVVNTTLLAVAAGPSNYGYPPPNEAQVFYQFALKLPTAALKDTAKKLEALRAAPPDFLKSMQYASYLSISQQAIDDARGRMLPQLFNDARAKAQTLAAAAGVTLGAVAGMSEFSSPNWVNAGWYFPMVSTAGFATTSSTSPGTATQVSYGLLVTFTVQ